MTIHLGTVPASSTLYIPFTTYGKTNGESITLTGLAVTDIEIYKNGSVTQRASDAGYTLLDTDGIDFDGITGLHGFSVDLSDNTDAGFYSVGAFYWVVVSSVTVDGQVVNFVAATFRIGPAEAIAGYQKVDVHAVNGTTQTAGDLAAMLAVIDDFLDTEIAAIKAKTDLLPAVAAGTNGGLPTTDANNYIAGIQGAKNQLDDLNDVSTAGVNAEVVDALNTDTYAEPGQEAPGATISLARKIGYLYKAWRNKKDSDGTTEKLYNDDAATVDQKRTLAEAGGTVTKGEVATGP